MDAQSIALDQLERFADAPSLLAVLMTRKHVRSPALQRLLRRLVVLGHEPSLQRVRMLGIWLWRLGSDEGLKQFLCDALFAWRQRVTVDGEKSWANALEQCKSGGGRCRACGGKSASIRSSSCPLRGGRMPLCSACFNRMTGPSQWGSSRAGGFLHVAGYGPGHGYGAGAACYWNATVARVERGEPALLRRELLRHGRGGGLGGGAHELQQPAMEQAHAKARGQWLVATTRRDALAEAEQKLDERRRRLKPGLDRYEKLAATLAKHLEKLERADSNLGVRLHGLVHSGRRLLLGSAVRAEFVGLEPVSSEFLKRARRQTSAFQQRRQQDQPVVDLASGAASSSSGGGGGGGGGGRAAKAAATCTLAELLGSDDSSSDDGISVADALSRAAPLRKAAKASSAASSAPAPAAALFGSDNDSSSDDGISVAEALLRAAPLRKAAKASSAASSAPAPAPALAAAPAAGRGSAVVVEPHVGMSLQKHFPGYGSFTGVVAEVVLKATGVAAYRVQWDDGTSTVMSRAAVSRAIVFAPAVRVAEPPPPGAGGAGVLRATGERGAVPGGVKASGVKKAFAAYAYWSAANREQVTARMPEQQRAMRFVQAALKEAWAQLPEADKAPWSARAAEETARFQRETAAEDASTAKTPVGGAGANPAAAASLPPPRRGAAGTGGALSDADAKSVALAARLRRTAGEGTKFMAAPVVVARNAGNAYGLGLRFPLGSGRPDPWICGCGWRHDGTSSDINAFFYRSSSPGHVFGIAKGACDSPFETPLELCRNCKTVKGGESPATCAAVLTLLCRKIRFDSSGAGRYASTGELGISGIGPAAENTLKAGAPYDCEDAAFERTIMNLPGLGKIAAGKIAREMDRILEEIANAVKSRAADTKKAQETYGMLPCHLCSKTMPAMWFDDGQRTKAGTQKQRSEDRRPFAQCHERNVRCVDCDRKHPKYGQAEQKARDKIMQDVAKRRQAEWKALEEQRRARAEERAAAESVKRKALVEAQASRRKALAEGAGGCQQAQKSLPFSLLPCFSPSSLQQQQQQQPGFLATPPLLGIRCLTCQKQPSNSASKRVFAHLSALSSHLAAKHAGMNILAPGASFSAAGPERDAATYACFGRIGGLAAALATYRQAEAALAAGTPISAAAAGIPSPSCEGGSSKRAAGDGEQQSGAKRHCAAAPSASAAAATVPATVPVITRNMLVRFYEKHNPANVGRVDELLGKHSADYIHRRLAEKYNVPRDEIFELSERQVERQSSEIARLQTELKERERQLALEKETKAKEQEERRKQKEELLRAQAAAQHARDAAMAEAVAANAEAAEATTAAAAASTAATAAEDKLECPVCFENERNTMVIPCGHTACSECLDQLTECPTCRTAIGSKHRFFL